MKNFFLFHFALLVVVFNSCAAQTPNGEFRIGKFENGKFTITENLDKVKAHWTSVVRTQNNTQQIGDISIISAVNQETRETYYLVVGKNTGQTFTIADEVSLKNGSFYFKNATVEGTLTCTGSGYGCDPIKVGKTWFCGTGCAGDCTKSITIQI